MRNRKRILILFTFVIAVICTIAIFPSNAQAASKNTLKQKLKSTTSQTIYKFYYADMDKNGSKEAVAITAEGKDDLGYYNAKIWYISGRKCSCFYKADLSIYSNSISLWSVKNTRMLKVEEGAGGSSSTSKAWTFTNGKVKQIKNISSQLHYEGKNKFTQVDSTFDAYYDGSMGCYIGHTWKPYYLYWNGKKMVEYGGKKLRRINWEKFLAAPKY